MKLSKYSAVDAAVCCVTSDSIRVEVQAPTITMPAMNTAALASRNCLVSFCSRQTPAIREITFDMPIAFLVSAMSKTGGNGLLPIINGKKHGAVGIPRRCNFHQWPVRRPARALAALFHLAAEQNARAKLGFHDGARVNAWPIGGQRLAPIPGRIQVELGGKFPADNHPQRLAADN